MKSTKIKSWNERAEEFVKECGEPAALQHVLMNFIEYKDLREEFNNWILENKLMLAIVEVCMRSSPYYESFMEDFKEYMESLENENSMREM